MSKDNGNSAFPELVISSCLVNEYLTDITEKQREKLVKMIKGCESIDDIALLIWFCSSDCPKNVALEQIKELLKSI